MDKKLTIGMAHYSDYDGVYFTIQGIVKELIYNGRRDLLSQIEFLIVENNPTCKHAKAVKSFAAGLRGLVKVIDLKEKQGTSCSRNKIIEQAKTNFVLVMDCHVMLCPTVKTIDSLISFISYNDKSEDLFTGPLAYDSHDNISTHFNDEWGGGMWGRWGESWKCICDAYDFSYVRGKDGKASFVRLSDAKRITKCEYCDKEFPKVEYGKCAAKLKEEGYNRSGFDDKEKPFEIFAQGLGLFLTRKNSWLKFNSDTSGFGGEECYIHEKYRKAGRKTICLPFLKWLHRFNRPDGVKYAVTTEQKLKNYMLEFNEIGLDLAPLKDHFVGDLKVSEEIWNNMLADAGSSEKPVQQTLESKIELLEKQLMALKSAEKKGCCKNKKKNNNTVSTG
tara:strand:- start:1917 stop:3086 length:1170 start_codon:yes stop_codon:yes gene_type:complete